MSALNFFVIAAAIVAAGWIGKKTVTRVQLELKYFSPGEFGVWFPFMSEELLQKIDAFREKWGAPVEVSKAPGAIGRRDETHSQHNVSAWGEVRAIDLFPKVPNPTGDGWLYMSELADRERAVRIAREVGLTGVGVYVDTVPGNMLHVDVRPEPLHWTRIAGKYNYGVIA